MCLMVFFQIFIDVVAWGTFDESISLQALDVRPWKQLLLYSCETHADGLDSQ